MAENPIFICENVLALIAAREASIDGATGQTIEQALDGFHDTSYKQGSAGASVTFKWSPVATTPSVDCVVLDSLFAEANVTVTVVRNGSTVYTSSTFNMVKGANLIALTSAGTITSGADKFTILVTATATKEFRHICAGQMDLVKNPISPFDPLKQVDAVSAFDNHNGVNIANSIDSSKKLLTASWRNIHPSSITDVTLRRLWTKCFDPKLPFWFFFRPTTLPKQGYLYRFIDQSEFGLSYESGNSYMCSIDGAEADHSPDRTVASY